MKFQEIEFGKGLKGLYFGLSRETVKEHLGEPDRIDEEFKGQGRKKKLQQAWWHYEAIGLMLGFSLEEAFRLTSMTFTSPDYKANGQGLIGEKRERVMDVISSLNFEIESVTEPKEKDTSELAGVATVTINNPSISLWFKNDVLKVIQTGPFFDDDETVVWPDSPD